MSASKREQLVRQALKVFYEGGFHAIGMDRIAKETGVSKTAIYKHFRTKDDLILATLHLRDQDFRNWLVRRVEALGQTPREKMIAIFDALGEWLAEPRFQGCMFVKASSEFQDRADPIHAAAAEHKRLLLTYFEGLARDAGAQDPVELARQILILKEGVIVMGHLHDPGPIAASGKASAEILLENTLGVKV